MAFNLCGTASACTGGFNHIRINCALREPLRLAARARFALKHFDKLRANDLTFLLWIGHARQPRDELGARGDIFDLYAERRHSVSDVRRLGKAQKATNDKY